MSADAMFWWNWWVNVAAAAGTISAVLVALFGEHSALSFSLRSYRLSWPTVTVRQPESKGGPVRKKHATTMFVSRTLGDGLPLTKFRSFCCRSRSLAQTGISRWFGVGTFQSGGDINNSSPLHAPLEERRTRTFAASARGVVPASSSPRSVQSPGSSEPAVYPCLDSSGTRERG